MEIFQDFGVNPVLLVAQIINFLIILYVLKRFMYKPLLSMLQKREDEIKKGLESAEESQRKLEEATQKEKEVLQKAQNQAEKIVSDAKKEAQELRAEMEEAARKESERLLTQARETIAQETKEAEDSLTKKIGTIAISMLEQSMKGIFGEKEQKIILEKAAAQLSKQTGQ
jgi:F-type H+-transporting ATPase subunit b